MRPQWAAAPVVRGVIRRASGAADRGATDFDLFPRELAERYFSDEQAIISSGEGLYNHEGPTLDAGGEKWVCTNKVPVADAQGRIVGSVGVGRDITEHRKAEAERERLIGELQAALADVRTLGGLVPICASCKRIRDDKGYWTQLEAYIQARTPAHFSHGICPECAKKLLRDVKGNAQGVAMPKPATPLDTVTRRPRS